MLYVHMGDGFDSTAGQNLTMYRGKVLRLTRAGVPPTDNPLYNAADGITAKDYTYEYGLRNPFGGGWRLSDLTHMIVENGPSVDRLHKLVPARNAGYDGSDTSMLLFASYNWAPSHGPVNLAFIQTGVFAGSGFPGEKMDHAFVTESGPTYGEGPQPLGKRIVEFVINSAGTLVSGPATLVEYAGSGRGSVVGLAAGPDGLYFSDLYKDFGAVTPVDRGAHVFRIRYVGVVDFSSDETACVAGTSVHFTDLSNVPAASAWHWEFGDGGVSGEQNPIHVYAAPGTFDVRLTVTGSGGDAVRQKAAQMAIAPAPRAVTLPAGVPSATQALEPR
jgi:hypothetical protein